MGLRLLEAAPAVLAVGQQSAVLPGVWDGMGSMTGTCRFLVRLLRWQSGARVNSQGHHRALS